MYRQAPVLCLLLILMCHGGTIETESSHVGHKGRLHLSNVLSQMGPAWHGSLEFSWDKTTELKPTTVFDGLLDAKLKRMNPSVQCSDNAMTLRVTRARVPHFLVDSGEGTLIPVSKMPSECGFSLRRSRRDVLLDAPYQGCYVTRQGGDYVLPLRLWGAPMTMSCPATSRLPSVSCFPAGMVVKLSGVTENDVKVKVSDTWRFLSSMCNTCGLAIEVFPGGLSLTAPYHKGLCITTKDDVHSLSLLLTDVELSASCPSVAENKQTTATTPSSDDPRLASSPVALSHALPRSALHAAPHSWINTQHQGVPASMSEMSPHYFWFATLAPLKNPGAHPALLQPHYGFPYVPQFHIAPWLAPSPAPPLTTTTTTTTTAAAMLTTEAPTQHNQKPLPQQPHVQIQTVGDPDKTRPELTVPHVYPRAYRIPVLYPPGKYFSRQQNKPFYYPPPYMPLYYPPPQKMHEFAAPPANHPS
uniref:uncharacterized protein LOC131106279 n=1 Tax=Doryrhamphus excisus TaxID=161450 RepID=UPI0025AEB821|nr:uncharacterized protein LOC131106279 [Doryrhamphus excisus]